MIFVGADAPQITPALLAEAAAVARTGRFALGPADDGGFYLFAGSRPIRRELRRCDGLLSEQRSLSEWLNRMEEPAAVSQPSAEEITT